MTQAFNLTTTADNWRLNRLLYEEAQLTRMQRNLWEAKRLFRLCCRRLRANLVPRDELLFYRETRRLEDYATLPVHAVVARSSNELLVPNKWVC